jgi:hypothetical protein
MNGALFGGQTSGGNDNEKRKKIFVIDCMIMFATFFLVAFFDKLNINGPLVGLR